ncbi:phosphonate transport system permease protein [Williamsoniiplasma somnilux]|uniref:Phosphonate transport system permease protein n=1 Tax=Williamsoniiplasma somnilux TaxID=215578 RepID=A0A2K8NYW8_9MOLU|nr:ABC transporter permease subunit [Williamsoniiplasma somnilux]ATZ18408.1 phosphonate transport system permease protein [Williamsoniiplasma somnilux]
MNRRRFNAIFNQKVLKIDGNLSKKPKRLFFWTMLIFTMFIIIFSFFTLDSKWSEFFRDLPNLFSRLKEMLHWDWNDFTSTQSNSDPFIKIAFQSILETIYMSIAGTFVGAFLAIPFAILASSNIIKNKFWNTLSRTILSIFRTIPSFVYALVLVSYFGPSTFTVMLALSIFTFSISGKSLYERIEQIDTKLFISAQATGASKFKSFIISVWPQISHHVLSITFYSLETNIRYVSIIAGVTNLGIGRLIDTSIAYDDWGRVGFLLTLLVVVILVLELIIWLTKKYIIEDKDFRIDQKLIKAKNKKISFINKQTNLKFYFEKVIAKNINSEILKEQKNSSRYKSLILQKRQMKHTFFKDYNQKVTEDNTKYKNIIKNHINENLFANDKETGTLIRIDKITKIKTKLKIEKLKIAEIEKIEEKFLKKQSEILQSLTVNNVFGNAPKKYLKKFILYGIMLLIFVLSVWNVKWDIPNSETIQQMNRDLLKIFNISWSSIFTTNENATYSVVYLLAETISIAVVGTFIGAFIAYVFGMLSSEKITNKYVARVFLLLTTMIRAVPTYIYALILVIVIGIGPFTGTMALIMGTIGMLTKYNRELFDDINQKVVFQLEATGLNWFGKIKYGVINQTSSSAISNIIYRFDINYKEVIVLGIVGAGNMGIVLKGYFNDQYFAEFGALLLGIIVVTLLIEYVSGALRNKINNEENIKWIAKLINLANQKIFIIFKANEKMLNLEKKLSFAESSALYTYTNQQIYSRAKNISKKNKTKFNKAWKIAYVEYFDLEISWEIPVEIVFKNHILEIKELKKQIRTKRKNWIIKTKLEAKKNLSNIKNERKNANDEIKKNELNNSIRYTKNWKKIKLTNINY